MVPEFAAKCIKPGIKHVKINPIGYDIATIEINWLDRIGEISPPPLLKLIYVHPNTRAPKHKLVERVCFPVPEEAKYLSDKTKEAFVIDSDLATAEKRMKQLMRVSSSPIFYLVMERGVYFSLPQNAPVFRKEMRQIQKNCERSNLYKFIHENISAFKVMILFAFLSPHR